jgi:hypothetical protein
MRVKRAGSVAPLRMAYDGNPEKTRNREKRCQQGDALAMDLHFKPRLPGQ